MLYSVAMKHLFLALVLSYSTLVASAPTARAVKRTYTTVTGFFQQDDAATDPDTFDFKTTNFGLKPLSGKPSGQTDWQFFASKVAELNAQSDAKTDYKVIFMARHGEGYHNAAQAYYGDFLWAVYWSPKDGNGTVTWADAHLTPGGIAETQAVNKFWASQLSTAKTPAPESYYVSPLYRTLDTARLTFSGLSLPAASPFKPTIKENLREQNGYATCNRRSNATYIRSSFPTYTVEPGFTEKDELWSPILPELPFALDARTKTVLDDVFTNDPKTFISFTSHSGTTESLLRVVGHRSFPLATAGVIPVLVKAVSS